MGKEAHPYCTVKRAHDHDACQGVYFANLVEALAFFDITTAITRFFIYPTNRA